jgi:D-serine deaminase-like pyridoxal phosphate-dependent protein
MAEQQRVRRRFSRRAMLAVTAAAVAAGVTGLRRRDKGGAHNDYFQRMSNALRDASVAHPVLIIDRDLLHANIASLLTKLAGSALKTRIVVKSLPAAKLIEEIATALNTNQFMVFNGAMLLDLARLRPAADVLLGKPMPVLELRAVHDQLATLAGGGPGPQWLIDTLERLKQYAEYARAQNLRLRVNLEIDVGFHRGGFPDAESLAQALAFIRGQSALEFSGLMGYDPHVPKVPSPKSAYAEVERRYRAAVDAVNAAGYTDRNKLTYNTAGSASYALHLKDPLATEIAVGSAFVKPKDFDLYTLTHHVPASFIATPVLKALDPLRVPSLEPFAPVLSFFDANSARAFFVYGGRWMAEPESPPGLEYNSLFGRSSNQELLTGSRSVALKPDDYVFLRPTQSEAVFLQFGDILVYSDGRIVDRWPTFPASA